LRLQTLGDWCSLIQRKQKHKTAMTVTINNNPNRNKSRNALRFLTAAGTELIIALNVKEH